MDTILKKLFNELDKRDVTIYDFAKQTGIPKERIYKWKQGAGIPKLKDSEIIKAWLSEEVTTNQVKDDSSEYHPNYQKKYLDLMERNNKTFERYITVNLNSIEGSQVQLTSLAVVQLNQLALIRAKIEGRPVAKLQDEINKEIAGVKTAKNGKDAGIQGKG